MYLKSIELSGFKSFAKKNGFEFNSPISAIVGPNGSGKSNVAEAFRFVLGEQSIKSMRGKRGEDLIWNGASSEPRANRAAVKLVFDNSRKVFSDIDFSEVTIERVVHRDGLNEYSINSSQVRLKDVMELLASAHIGISSHHIISQGEADKILAASPKDRKGMVEDALGLKIYQYKRLESERKLKKTFENIGQVQALRKEIAPHLKFLNKQVEKFEKSEALRQELLNLSTQYLKQKEIHIEKLRAEVGPMGREVSIKVSKEELIRELGRIEGQISAEEHFAERELAQPVSLEDLENLYQEINLWQEASKILARIKDFISNKKQSGNLTKDISELKKRKLEVEASIQQAELQGVANELRIKEKEFTQELEELSHVLGPHILQYKHSTGTNADLIESKKNIERLKFRLEEAGVVDSEEVLKEYRDTSERDAFLERELTDLDKSAKSLEEIIKDLEKRLATEFSSGLERINSEFGKMFGIMFGGGEAQLTLIKSESLVEEVLEVEEVDKLEEGLDIKVNLPKKKIKSLMMLSGGERALTSIALIFAVSQVNPPPFIILDETDAALDESNSKKYGDLVEILSKRSQLILITHNRETMSRAGVIYGVTMGSNGVSKLLSISFDQAVEVAK